MNVVSERLVQLPNARWVSVLMSTESMTTASGFPLRGTSVKTSTWALRWISEGLQVSQVLHHRKKACADVQGSRPRGRRRRHCRRRGGEMGWGSQYAPACFLGSVWGSTYTCEYVGIAFFLRPTPAILLDA